MKRLRNALLIILFSNSLLINGIAISPKLDFSQDSGVVEVKRDLKGGKIKGLRVTVDTSELKESKSSGSDSSASSDSSSEKKKTIGVRTDVTFEITSGENTNDTKSVDEKEIGKDDDNASIPVVPVFKGTPDRGGSTKGIDSSYNEILSVVPLENPSNPPRIPFHQQPPHSQHNGYRNQYGGGDGEIVNSNNDGWKVYPQYAIWTTERNNNGGHHRRLNQPPAIFHHHNEGGQFDIYKKPSSFIPYQIDNDHHRQLGPSWKQQPCACKEYPGPHFVGVQPLQPPAHDEFKHTNKIDDKLERPFSRTNKK